MTGIESFPLDYNLRRMLLSDLQKVMAVERRVYSIPWSEKNFESCILANYECLILAAEEGHVGHSVLSAAAGESHLLNLSIDSNYQGQGLGKGLLRHMLARARQLSATVTFLEVRASNQRAYQLYISEGFNEVGTRKGYYPAGKYREDALVLAIEL